MKITIKHVLRLKCRNIAVIYWNRGGLVLNEYKRELNELEQKLQELRGSL
jgi:hypothetical protein